MPQDRSLDIVLFGATGFTGGLVAEYLASHGGKLRWALAGRDREKLERVRARLPGEPPEITIADARDATALREMAQRTRVVLTTVGPYIRHGEPLVKACAEAGTHYVDLTGEPPFVDLVRARYHDRAVTTGAKIVNACGFDSIPHDLGVYFTLQALRRRMSEAERESTPIRIEGIVRARASFSGGTWQSMLEIIGGTRRATDEKPREPASPRKVGSLSHAIRYRPELGLWLVPMPSIDPLVVSRSARLLPEYGPDFRYGHYLGLRHLYEVSALVSGVGSLALLAQFGPTRSLLRKIRPSGAGPDEATRAKSWFRVLFRARAGSHKVACEVRGGDPGYGETAKMISEAALCLAFDQARLPPHVGIVPSAAALGNPLIERLTRAGITFRELGEDR